jgi:hypothetical protein
MGSELRGEVTPEESEVRSALQQLRSTLPS